MRCCKKHWNWIGHPNDTRKHPTRPRYAEDYNRSLESRIGYFGYERPLEQPPHFLQQERVETLAENCNAWPDEDPMTNWTDTKFYKVAAEQLGQSGAMSSASVQWMTLLTVTLTCLMCTIENLLSLVPLV